MLEHLFLVGNGDADAGVGDIQLPFRTIQLKTYVYLSAFRGVFHGVAQQVMEDGIHLVGVYPTFYWSFRSYEGQLDVFIMAVRLERFRKIADVLVQVAFHYIDVGRVEFFLLEIYQFIGQLGKAIRASDGILQVLQTLVGECFGPADFAEGTLDECQRCTDVVCRMDEELYFLAREYTVFPHPEKTQ